MEKHEFDRGTAEALMEMILFPEAGAVQNDGVFVAEDFRICSPPEQAFDWTPAYDMDWPGAPNPITAPALPIPFTAGELAAFMLDGLGAGLPKRLDRRIGYSLDDVVLEHFGKRERLVREALRSAYVLAERAQSVVGEFDYEEQRRAYDLLKQLDDANGHANEHEGVFAQGITDVEASQRRARAKASVADLEARALRAKAEVDAKWTAWRAAMVRQLLHPEPQATAPSPAPVVAESASGGTMTLWTPERKAQARAMQEKLKGEGVKAYAQRTADSFNVTPTRLRAVLSDKAKKAPAKRAKSPWDI